MKLTHTLAALSVALLAAGTSLAADAQPDPWRISATIPVWASGVDGDVTFRGSKQDVGISFDQLKDHLDAAFSMGLEARRQKYGFFGDVGYMKFSGSASAHGASGATSLKLLIADAGGFYQLIKTAGDRPFILEATAGLRFWYLETDNFLRGPKGSVLVNGGSSWNLYDPVIGLRGSQFLARKWHLDFQSDVGGFGISDDSSDLSWSAAGMVTYDAAQWCSLSAGYKALSVANEDGSGKHEKGADLIFHGLLIAAKFTF